jgi:hypothetical protein
MYQVARFCLETLEADCKLPSLVKEGGRMNEANAAGGLLKKINYP